MMNYLHKRLIPAGPLPHYLSFSAETLVISIEDSYQVWNLNTDSISDFKEGGRFNAISPCGKYCVMLGPDQTLFQVLHVASGVTLFSAQVKANPLWRTPFCFQGGKLWFSLYKEMLSSIDLTGNAPTSSVHHWEFRQPWTCYEMFAIGADRLAFVGQRHRGENDDWYVYPSAQITSASLERQFDPSVREFETAHGFALADADGDGLYCLRDHGFNPFPDPEEMEWVEWNGLAYVDTLNKTSERIWPLQLSGRLASGAPMLVGEKSVVVGLMDGIEVFDRKDGSFVTRFEVERNQKRWLHPPMYAFDPARRRFAFLKDRAIQVVEID